MNRRTSAAAAVLLTAVTVAGCTSSGSHTGPTTGPSLAISGETITAPQSRIALSKLAGATVATSFQLVDDTKGVSRTRFYLDNGSTTYLGGASKAPFTASLTVPAGSDVLQVRHDVNGSEQRLTVHFTAGTGGTSASGATPSGTIPPLSGPGTNNQPAGNGSKDVATGPAPSWTPPAAAARPLAQPAPTVTVSTTAQLTAALAAARAGTVIRLADGTYQARGRWQLAASGTAGHPITLEGSRAAILTSGSVSGDYGLWITGSWWQVMGLSVTNSSKGIVLDRAQHTVIDSVDVGRVGDEGIHVRTCSSDTTIQFSSVHQTGLVKPQFGEGIYVGSAHSNWGKYGCSDGRDASERTVVQNVTVTDTPAEGVDIKEGTDSGVVRASTFTRDGTSGQNSADSAFDVKGNGWSILGNTINPPSGADLDAIQVHQVYTGYGVDNLISGNQVLGAWPGFGIGLYQSSNTVSCSNSAAQSRGGLVGLNRKTIRCS